LCGPWACPLFDALIAYSDTDVPEDEAEEGGRPNERPEMAALLSEGQVIGPSTL